MSLADQLGETRAEIKLLKQREAALRSAILAADGAVPDGRWHRVSIVEQQSRRFNKDLLPSFMIADPFFYTQHTTTIVRTMPVQCADTPALPWRRHRQSALQILGHV